MAENVDSDSIYVTGNTVIDALFKVQKIINSRNELKQKLEKQFEFLNNKRVMLVTGHRRENFGTGFEDICNALLDISRSMKDIIIVYPVHLNPNVREPVNRLLGGVNNIHLIEPLEYVLLYF